MRLSEAKSESKPLTVAFSGATLNVTYRVPEYTPNQAAMLQAEASKDPRRIAESLVKILDSWDLEHDSGDPIPLTVEEIAEHVPMSVIVTVIRAINADQMPGEARETSNAG